MKKLSAMISLKNISPSDTINNTTTLKTTQKRIRQPLFNKISVIILFMIDKFLRKYFSIIFIVATLLGVMHHHHDDLQHSDCKVCTLQSNIVNADTPSEKLYLTQLDTSEGSVISQLQDLCSKASALLLHARAPPHLL